MLSIFFILFPFAVGNSISVDTPSREPIVEYSLDTPSGTQTTGAAYASELLQSAASVLKERVEIDDAPFRHSNRKAKDGIFEGFHLEKHHWWKDKKTVCLTFIFSQDPYYGLSYFVDHNSDSSFYAIDFIDSSPGISSFARFSESPFDSITYQEYSVNLNKNVPWMKSDLRNIFRIKLYTSYIVNFSISANIYGELALQYDWSERIAKISKLRRKKGFFSSLFTYGG